MARKKKRRLWEQVFDVYSEENPDMGFEWQNMPPEQRLAVSLGHLYFQIRRNGFGLWIGNGYAGWMTEEIVNHLDSLETEAALAVRALMLEAVEIAARVDALEERAEAGDESTDEEFDEVGQRCDDLSEAYFECCDALMDDVDSFIERLPAYYAPPT